MYKPKNTKEQLLHRLKICRGHLNKVSLMIDQEEYCIDISHQLQAIRKAMRRVDELIVEDHIRSKLKSRTDLQDFQLFMREITLLMKQTV